MPKLERRNYRKVYQRLWNNPEFLAMADALKTTTMYLLTGPQTNRVGLFRVSFGAMAETLRIPIMQAQKRLAAVCAAFGWEFDQRCQVLWIPSWWAFNPLTENPKNLKGYLTDLNDLPRTALIAKFCANLEYVPENQHADIQKWIGVLSPIDHRSVTDTITDRTTQTLNTLHSTETETEARENTDAPRQPVRPAFEHYHARFIERYHVKPEYAPKKDAARMARLLRTHGLETVKVRIDAYFASSDRFFAETKHTLDVFFSSGTQTKLATMGTGPPGLSDLGRGNLAAVDEGVRLIQERHGNH